MNETDYDKIRVAKYKLEDINAIIKDISLTRQLINTLQAVNSQVKNQLSTSLYHIENNLRKKAIIYNEKRRKKHEAGNNSSNPEAIKR